MNYSFGNWVKRRRKNLDLTQQMLAQQVGCSVTMIVKIESDDRRPSRQMAELLARQLEIPTDQIPLFLKTARQEKSTDSLDAIPPHPALEPVPASKLKHSNLLVSPTPLIGREHEIRVITRQLLELPCRMLTLTGPGGIGKTRLALEVANQLETQFADGVFFISLAGISMIESIVPAIADILGLSFSGPAAPIVQLVTYLRTKKVLLVLDNMEHLVEGGNLLGEILQQTQHLKMLLTSREQIRLQWEWLFEVQGLPIPETINSHLENNSAFMLFVQRAHQTSQNFSLEKEDAHAIIRICKLVGGLPLALELAASWARVLSCREIALELERSLDLLETKKVDIPQRHRSIKTVFDHSWTLLTKEERTLLMQLSVFQGGFTREAALAATGTSLLMLSSLVDKSLLRHKTDPDRYDLHELTRQYAFAKLQADPAEEMLAYEKYAAYYADWIAALEKPFKSAQQPQTSQLIRSETSNWLSCWHWAVEHQRTDLLRKMVFCLNWYFEVHGFYDEALSAYKTAVEKLSMQGAPTSLKPWKRKPFSQLWWIRMLGLNSVKGISNRHFHYLPRVLEIALETDDTEVLYYIYGNWGYLCLMTGEVAEAGRLTTESLRYGKMLTPWHVTIPINVLGIVAYQQGNLQEAYHQLTESLKIWRPVGDPRGLVFCMLYLGMTTLALNDISATRSILNESNTIAEAKMDRWAQAFGLDMLGMVCLSQGQNEEAVPYFRQSIALSKEIGDQLNGTQTTIHLGMAHAAIHSNEEAKCLFLEAYVNACSAKWTPIILNVLIAFAEMQDELSAETKLAVALSVLEHSAITPNMRVRCEKVRDEAASTLSAQQIQNAEALAKEKKPEDWAQEILK
ncbi:MAG: NB-ARC domain-containing protein [Anaerolineales bacterium]